MPNVFISHSSHDKAFVRNLASELRRRQISVWIDERQIKVGQPIPRRIKQGTAQCEFFLIVLSHNAVQSRWVADELHSAYFYSVKDHDKSILPVLLEDIEIPDEIAYLRYADFRSSFDEGLNELLAAFHIDEAELPFLTRSERLKRIENLLKSVDRHGDMPFEILDLVEDESYLEIFEKKLHNATERRVLHNALTALKYLATGENGRVLVRHDSVDRLMKLYAGVANPETKRRVVETLASIDSVVSLGFLIELLATESSDIKAAVLGSGLNQIQKATMTTMATAERKLAASLS